MRGFDPNMKPHNEQPFIEDQGNSQILKNNTHLYNIRRAENEQ